MQERGLLSGVEGMTGCGYKWENNAQKQTGESPECSRQETQVRFLGQKDSLEKEMGIHSYSILVQE